jgi:hypothetical protein
MCNEIDLQNVASAKSLQRKLESLPLASQVSPFGKSVNSLYAVTNDSGDGIGD